MTTKIMIMLMIMTPTMKHPISMGSMLIIQTTILTTIMSEYLSSSWFSYILFITIVGGLMVMFIYMASIASNEKFHMNKSSILMVLMTIISMEVLMNKEITMEYLNKMLENKLNSMEKEELKSLSKFFNLNKMNLTMMIMITLLLTMISVTNISSTFEGPLKKTYV
nr:NADH dehydrogenase subunit 6 [Paravarcia sp.]